MDRIPVRQGRIELLPDVDEPGGWLLTVDGASQSYIDIDHPTHLEFEYTRRIAHLVDIAPPFRDVAHLGAGALTLPRYLAAVAPECRQQVVDIDGELIDVVRRFLPWAGPDPIRRDAREFMESLPVGSLDLVIADIFSGSRIPARVTSTEFVRAVANSLRPGGCYVSNVADGSALDFARAQAATVGTAWRACWVIAEPAVLRGRRFGNLLLVGTDADLDLPALSRRLAADPFPARVVDGSVFAGGVEPITDATAVDSPQPPGGAFSIG